jgi:aminoglycoside/choline kinase family phosphotransferase
MTAELRALFFNLYSEQVDDLYPMAVHASKRSLYRLKNSQRSVIGVEYRNLPENRAFISFSKHFKRFGLPVPEIYAVAEDEFFYLHEDLGDQTLFDLVTEERGKQGIFNEKLERLYAEAVQHLSYFQIEAAQGLDYSLCYEGAVYDQKAMHYDCQRFVVELVNRMAIPFDATRLQHDFDVLVSFLSAEPPHYFMYRDFQARNIMVKEGKTFFIDYQSGRKGALQYDLASLLYQSQARIPDEVRDRIVSFYLDQIGLRVKLNRDQFLELFDGFVLIRLLQVLGAYGKLGLGERKEYFLKGIPFAVATFLGVIGRHRISIKFPEITTLFSRLALQLD